MNDLIKNKEQTWNSRLKKMYRNKRIQPKAIGRRL